MTTATISLNDIEHNYLTSLSLEAAKRAITVIEMAPVLATSLASDDRLGWQEFCNGEFHYPEENLSVAYHLELLLQAARSDQTLDPNAARAADLSLAYAKDLIEHWSPAPGDPEQTGHNPAYARICLAVANAALQRLPASLADYPIWRGTP